MVTLILQIFLEESSWSFSVGRPTFAQPFRLVLQWAPGRYMWSIAQSRNHQLAALTTLKKSLRNSQENQHVWKIYLLSWLYYIYWLYPHEIHKLLLLNFGWKSSWKSSCPLPIRFSCYLLLSLVSAQPIRHFAVPSEPMARHRSPRVSAWWGLWQNRRLRLNQIRYCFVEFSITRGTLQG